jgi:hypothetical protein
VSAEEAYIGHGSGRARKEKAIHDVREGSRIEEMETHVLEAGRQQTKMGSLSRPLLKIATWRYWFRLSRDVYDGNRSFASYTKTKTVESDV